MLESLGKKERKETEKLFVSIMGINVLVAGKLKFRFWFLTTLTMTGKSLGLKILPSKVDKICVAGLSATISLRIFRYFVVIAIPLNTDLGIVSIN